MIDSWFEALAVIAAGAAAGGINTIVGSGTLITFPTLLAFGLPPVVANVTNNVGLVPGSVSGALGDRESLTGQRRRLLTLLPASLLGAGVGALLLLRLPSSAFDSIVPFLIGLGVVLVIVGPWLSRRLATRAAPGQREWSWWVWPAVGLTGVYGGYFGAAQGVLLMAVLGIGIDDTMRRHNATKNVLSAATNGLAAVVFALVAHIDWAAAGLVALGAVVGGQIGARIGKRISPWALRVLIVLVGVIAIVKLSF